MASSGVSAAAPGWWQVSGLLDYTPHASQPGLSNILAPSESCRACHRGPSVVDAQTMPYNSWAGSMMANAVRDPVFWAALDVANHDGATNGAPDVGDFCLRCHAPKAWYDGRVRKNGLGGTVNGSNGCLLQGDYDNVPSSVGSSNMVERDYGGESCHYCHRLMDHGPLGEPKYLQNANTWLDDGDCDGQGEPCRRGPYTYAEGEGPPHAWNYSTYHQSSDICGSCHNVTTPDTSAGPLRTLRDAAGVDTGVPFPIERTYNEWKQSDFGDLIFRDRLGDALAALPQLARARQCQDCHMPNSSDAEARACIFDNPGARTNDLRVHTLTGGNTWIPGVLKGQYGTALDRNAEFDQTIVWARQTLQASARVDTSITSFVPPVGPTQGSLVAQVKVTNLSGHKLPTGYVEGRRMWIDFVVRDHNGALLFESGAYNAGSATLTADAQAKVYETIHGIWDAGTSTCKHTDVGGNPEFHFVLNNCIAKDNRIPPLGFSGAADVETRPVAYTYPTVAGSTRLVNFDLSNYSVSVPTGTALPLSVTATLKYQTSSREYIEFLRNQAVTFSFPGENTMCSAGPDRPFAVGPQGQTRGQYLYDLWNNPTYGKSPPEDVAGATASAGN
ncbi:MAG: hypothetical protein ABI411_08600 [Tahibacter sp.]